MARRVVNNAGASSNAIASVMRQADSFRKERERIVNLSQEDQKNLTRDIPVDDLVPFPENEDVFGMDEGQIALTAGMIREHGFWGAIWVTPYRDGKYMIISGHQRWKAAKEAGQTTIPAFVYNLDQETVYRMWIDSNQLQRKSTPYAKAKLIESARKHIQERAEAGDPAYIGINTYDKLVELTHIGKSAISRFERIMKFPPFTLSCCKDESFPYTVVLPVAKFSDEAKTQFDEALKQYMVRCQNDPNPEVIRGLVGKYQTEKPPKSRDTYANLPEEEKAEYDEAKEHLRTKYFSYVQSEHGSTTDSVDTELEDMAMKLYRYVQDGTAVQDPKRVTASIDMLTKCIKQLRTKDGVY